MAHTLTYPPNQTDPAGDQIIARWKVKHRKQNYGGYVTESTETSDGLSFTINKFPGKKFEQAITILSQHRGAMARDILAHISSNLSELAIVSKLIAAEGRMPTRYHNCGRGFVDDHAAAARELAYRLTTIAMSKQSLALVRKPEGMTPRMFEDFIEKACCLLELAGLPLPTDIQETESIKQP